MECFVLIGKENCFGVIVRSLLHIKGCKLDRWKDLMYVVWVIGNS